MMVEVDPSTELPIRIFKLPNMAFALPPERVREWPKRDAIEAIRRQVFAREKFRCRHCDKRLTWDIGEMNEIVPKGKGGEVSLDNCELLCHGCHQGRPDSVHGDRRWNGRQ